MNIPHVSFSLVKLKLHAENQLSTYPGIGLKLGWWVHFYRDFCIFLISTRILTKCNNSTTISSSVGINILNYLEAQEMFVGGILILVWGVG